MRLRKHYEGSLLNIRYRIGCNIIEDLQRVTKNKHVLMSFVFSTPYLNGLKYFLTNILTKYFQIQHSCTISNASKPNINTAQQFCKVCYVGAFLWVLTSAIFKTYTMPQRKASVYTMWTDALF